MTKQKNKNKVEIGSNEIKKKKQESFKVKQTKLNSNNVITTDQTKLTAENNNLSMKTHKITVYTFLSSITT